MAVGYISRSHLRECLEKPVQFSMLVKKKAPISCRAGRPYAGRWDKYGIIR